MTPTYSSNDESLRHGLHNSDLISTALLFDISAYKLITQIGPSCRE